MKRTAICGERVRELVGDDLRADQLEGLAHVDGLLRAVAAGDRASTSGPAAKRREDRPSSRLVAPPAGHVLRPHRADKQTHELKLTFSELSLVYKSLQAVRTLGELPTQDELLNDTLHLVEQALQRAV
jgi:hypothetical protein